MSGASLARVAKAWGAQIPDWVHLLATECDRTSQSAVAKEIRLSPTTINQVLGKCYRADLAKIEQAVRGRFLRESVVCLILGDLTKDKCLATQERVRKSLDAKHAGALATNPVRVQLARTCPGCPHHAKNLKGETDAE